MKLYVLENDQLRVELLDIGAAIYAFRLKARKNRNIVLNTSDLNNYLGPDNGYFGATVGPVAGRIPDGILRLDGKTHHLDINEKGLNTLHGGKTSFAFRPFEVISQTKTVLVFRYISDDNEGGFPGILTVQVTYTLLPHALQVTYAAQSTKKTILNITNHSYFNLNGDKTILDHFLKLQATDVYRLDDHQINRKRQPIEGGSLFDCHNFKRLRDIIQNPKINKKPTMGLDHLLLVPSGQLVLEGQDVSLVVTSDVPAYQLYSTNFPPLYKGENGQPIMLYQGLAIEPVSVVSGKTGKYPTLEVNPGTTYKRDITYQINLKN